jgi:hypothetical protein
MKQQLKHHLELWHIHYLDVESDVVDLTVPSIYVHPTISRDFTGTNDQVVSKILAPLAERSERRADMSIPTARSERSVDLSLLRFSSKCDGKTD